jgi:hypothetical protein
MIEKTDHSKKLKYLDKISRVIAIDLVTRAFPSHLVQYLEQFELYWVEYTMKC